MTHEPDDLDKAEMEAHWFYQDVIKLSMLPDYLFRIARHDAIAAARVILEREDSMKKDAD